MFLITAATDGIARCTDALAATDGWARFTDVLAGMEVYMGKAGVLATEGLDPGRIANTVIAALIAGAVAALVTSVIALPILRQQLKATNAQVDAQGRTIESHAGRLQAIETACPEQRMAFVRKDEIVRMTSQITAMRNDLFGALSQVDQHNETRVSEVHDRVNAIQAAVGEIQGMLNARKERP